MKNEFGKAHRSALLTGAAGFVGYRLAERLLRDGWSVHLLVRKSSDSGKLASLRGTLKLHQYSGMIDETIAIVQQAKPEVVFHLASEVLIHHEPEQIESLIRSNIGLGTQLLEAMVKAGVKNFINTGTFWQHYQGETYNPVNLYAATKQAFEDIIHYYRESCQIRAVTLKLFDVYGPKDTRDKLFTLLAKTFKTGEALALSPGEQLLDFVYIDDVVEAFIRAADLLHTNSDDTRKPSYAVSSSQPISLKEVVGLYQSLAGKPLNVIWGGRPYRSREIMTPWKGELLPGWKTTVNLETGIQRLISELNSDASAKLERKSTTLNPQIVQRNNSYA